MFPIDLTRLLHAEYRDLWAYVHAPEQLVLIGTRKPIDHVQKRIGYVAFRSGT